jgi:hypothetical protein
VTFVLIRYGLGMRVLTALMAVCGCGVWLGYACLAALAADIEGGDDGAQLVIAVTGVASLAAAAWLGSRRLRLAATVAMLVSAAELVLWLTLV